MHAFCESCVLFHMSYFKLHYAPLRTSHFSLHSSHSTLRTPHFTLHSSCPTLHTALFTLHTYTPPFISSELFSPYPSSSLLISSLLICHLSFHESLPSTTSRTCHAPCASQTRACVLCAKLLQRCCPRTCARPRCTATPSSTFLTLHIALFTPHTPHFTLAPHLNSSHLSSSHLISCLPICQLSSSWLFSCHLSAAQPFSSHRS